MTRQETKYYEASHAVRLTVPVGPRVVELLDLAYRARRPVLLEGPTGIGKSQVVTEFARSSGLQVIVLDLSLLEPPDLVGLPVIQGGRTSYASPAELPASGRGVLMLEELNRAEIPVMQPALQLLSARRLHGYELPPDWSCVAAINPEDGDYHVNRLDHALRSRFLQVSVCADRDTWLGWAARTNVHPLIQQIARDHLDLFDHASPRSWTYASLVLQTMKQHEIANSDLVRVALRGYLPAPWAMLVAEALTRLPFTPRLDADVLLGPEGEAELARRVREATAATRVDLLAMLASNVRHLLAGAELATRASHGAVTLASLERLLAPLPGDLRDQCLETAVESPAATALFRSMGHEPSEAMSGYANSRLRVDLKAWRGEMKLHRVRLVVLSVLRWLEGDPSGATEARAIATVGRALSLLASDAGPLASDLARWLDTRGVRLEQGAGT